MRMKRVYIITVLTAIAVIAAVTGIYRMVSGDEEEKKSVWDLFMLGIPVQPTQVIL